MTGEENKETMASLNEGIGSQPATDEGSSIAARRARLRGSLTKQGLPESTQKPIVMARKIYLFRQQMKLPQ